jgi:hypothetical protein
VKAKAMVLPVRRGSRDPVTVTSSPRMRAKGDTEQVMELEILLTEKEVGELDAPS